MALPCQHVCIRVYMAQDELRTHTLFKWDRTTSSVVCQLMESAGGWDASLEVEPPHGIPNTIWMISQGISTISEASFMSFMAPHLFSSWHSI